MSPSVCIICCCHSDPIDLKTCASWECEAKICTECLVRYLELASREHTVPRCLSPGCSGLFLRSACTRSLKVYDTALFHGLLHDPDWETTVKLQYQQRRLREELVQERETFLELSFPGSIRRAVHIMYASDLRRVHKSNLETVHDRVVTRRCGRIFCKGFMRLDLAFQKWTCGTCSSSFCQKCELRYEKEPHECRFDEVASVELKNSLPHCPTCHQTIEKSYGCDNMTCAVCGTHFSYTTGEKTTHGNHGADQPVVLSSETGLERLWLLLLRERNRTQLTAREEKLAKELEEVENLLPSLVEKTQWKFSDIPALSQWVGDEDKAQEEKMAKAVALRVEKLETKRQQSRRLWTRLRHLEDEIVAFSAS